MLNKARIFDQVAVTAPDSSTFDMSHTLINSFNMGQLVPLKPIEVLPGDVIDIGHQAMFRMAPMIAPPMSKVRIKFEYFFVPNRILWPKWERFITGGETAAQAALPPAHPYILLAEIAPGDLADHLGCPGDANSRIDAGMQLNAFPFAGYQRIFHEWYRSEDLQPGDPIELIDGDQGNYVQLVELQNRAWEHDYFTSCLPYAQKGEPVALPIDFIDDDLIVQWKATQDEVSVAINAGNGDPILGAGSFGTDASGNIISNAGVPFQYDPAGSLAVDTDALQFTSTLNDLRTAWALQSFLEKNMRAGSRYKESIQAHWNVNTSDARLQRPEYIGGTESYMAMSEVLQTSQTGSTPQANMAGHGISVAATGNMHYRAEEWGFIHVLVSIVPETMYFQGLPKFFSRFNLEDYANPAFAGLGEQEVLNQELYWSQTDAENENTFGYLPRYSEYRFIPSGLAGTQQTSLLHWNMARNFTSRPGLNGSFIKSSPTLRNFAVTDPSVEHIYGQIMCQCRMNRKLPVFGIPTPLT